MRFSVRTHAKQIKYHSTWVDINNTTNANGNAIAMENQRIQITNHVCLVEEKQLSRLRYWFCKIY